jgi:hypothetical protein
MWKSLFKIQPPIIPLVRGIPHPLPLSLIRRGVGERWISSHDKGRVREGFWFFSFK